MAFGAWARDTAHARATCDVSRRASISREETYARLKVLVRVFSNFYDEISTPLMFDLDFRYDENIVDIETVTQTKFPTFFRGDETLIVARFRSDVLNFRVEGADGVGERRKRDAADADVDAAGGVVRERSWCECTLTGEERKSVRKMSS